MPFGPRFLLSLLLLRSPLSFLLLRVVLRQWKRLTSCILLNLVQDLLENNKEREYYDSGNRSHFDFFILPNDDPLREYRRRVEMGVEISIQRRGKAIITTQQYDVWLDLQRTNGYSWILCFSQGVGLSLDAIATS
jgi:hypothetical protein